MRIKHFFGLAVLAAMTASCSSNNDLVNGGGNGSSENETGASYASFSINLPTTSGTRADNPEFKPGETNEYDVFNATLLVFKEGTTAGEGNYTLAETVDLGSMEPWKNPSETGVTTQAKITAKLSNVDKSGNYFALVLLNNGSGTDAKVTLPSVGDTFSAWNVATKANATNFTDTKKGFYMANAPLYNAADKSVTTLVAIDKNKIFPTEAQASSGEAAADIYVERGLAKVTLTAATKEEKPVATSSSYAGDKVTIKNWALDVTNLKTFPIHNVDKLGYEDIWKNEAAASGDPSTQRFVDNNSGTLAKRVYWGKDPNYDKDDLRKTDEAGKTARAAEFNYVTANTKVTADPTKPLYCLENTFNLANMVQGQTTRVIFKASYTPKDFTAADGKTFFKVGTSVALWSQKNLETHIKTAVTKVISGTTADDITINLAAEGNNITTAGNHEIKASNITVTGHEVTDAEVKDISEKVGLTEKAGISTYANGESYYIARIKHFGDDLTPWHSGEAYNDNNLKYLGRYGMLRNNWYELDVQSVSGPGYPDVPEVKPNTPDDEDDMYIKVSVKILDWAKRSQSVDL